jgi:carbon-monoxide dehydrogenase medium subunit
MKPAPFKYLAPHSLEETLQILQGSGGEAKLLAGGQSLVPAMNFRLAQPALLVDLNRLPDLDYIYQDDHGVLRLGAMARQRRLEHDPLVAQAAPLVAETMPSVAHPQIRNRGTLGGSLAYADPAAELPVIALALGARFKLCRAGSERWIEAQDFFKGVCTTDLSPDEMLVEMEIPPLPERAGWAFLEVSRRQGDYALMGVAALLVLDERGACQDARLVYLNAGDGPVVAREAAKLLLGKAIGRSDGPAIDRASIEAAAQLASQREIDPWGNVHASPAFQRHLARELTIQALEIALGRAADDKKKTARAPSA